MMTAAEILQKHEDANEMHLHHVDRKWVIQAMEEYAKEKSEKPINLIGKQTAVEWIVKELELEGYPYIIKQAKKMEKEQIIEAFNQSWHDRMNPYKTAEKYYNETYKGGEQ